MRKKECAISNTVFMLIAGEDAVDRNVCVSHVCKVQNTANTK